MIGANFFKETFIHNGKEYPAQKSSAKQVMIPLISNDCPFVVGDTITQKIGSGLRDFEIEDYDVKGSAGIFSAGSRYMAYLDVRPLDVKQKNSSTSTINFNAPINAGGDFQAGSVNTINKNVTFQQVDQAVAESDDPEVKGMWEKITNNPAFLAILSAVAGGVAGS